MWNRRDFLLASAVVLSRVVVTVPGRSENVKTSFTATREVTGFSRRRAGREDLARLKVPEEYRSRALERLLIATPGLGQ